MHRENKKRKIIIFSLIGILLCMAVVYAAVSTTLQIEGTSEITSSWDIKITDVTSGTATGDAENAKVPDWDELSASFEANLYSKGDAMEYDVTITNNGTLDAKLDDIITNTQNANEEAVIITFTGYKKGEVLKSKTSKIVHVKIAYNPNYNGDETSSEVDLTFDFVQDNKDPDNPQTYMLTYDYETNGGTRADSEGEFLEAGTTVDLSKKAYKDGWKFVGWNTNKDAKEPLSSFEMTASNTTLYAIFKKDAKTITLTFNKNGATSQTPSSGGASSNDTVKETCTIPEVYNNEIQDTTCNITAPLITPAIGFTTLGYETSSSSTTASWTQRTEKAVSVNTIYYAITRSENPYTANFNQNGATSISSTNESCYRYNGASSCNITTPAIIREGFNIAGWGEQITSTSAIVKANSALNLNKNVTYYAVTSKEVNVTYQKGTNIESIGAESGKCTIQNNNTTCQVALPSITPITGYVSVGWNTSSGATTGTPAGSKLTLSNDATYYANAIDNVGPEITFEPNTQSTFISGGKTVNVIINDAASGLKANQAIYYAWSESKDIPPTFTNTLTMANTAGAKTAQITIPETLSSNFTGSYYLWIKEGIQDTLGNQSEAKVSEVFKFDNTNPTLTISTTSTSSTITVVANAEAASGISKYEYSIDEGKTWIDAGTDSTYRFTGLEQGTSYPISVRVTSGVGKIALAEATKVIDLTDDVTTSGDGLYEDKYEDGRHIYKGANPNNYVRFNDQLWRIVALETDGTMKIIKYENIGSQMFDKANTRPTSNNTYCKESANYGCHVWGAIDGTYSNADNSISGTVTKDSSLNTYLNTTYYNTLTETAKKQIANRAFYIGTINTNLANLANTINQEKTYTWIGNLGLINASDYIKASNNSACVSTNYAYNNVGCKNNNYLYKTNHKVVTINGRNNNSRAVVYVNTDGKMNNQQANTNSVVFPVTYLKSNVKIIGGEGTQTNPYELGEGVSTTTLEKPTFTQEGLFPKTVTIHFPEGCGDTLTCSYQQDNGQTVNVITETVNLEYSQNGDIVATVSDGDNTVTSSYTVKIELRAVDISYTNTKTGMDCVEAQCALEEIDKRR